MSVADRTRQRAYAVWQPVDLLGDMGYRLASELRRMVDRLGKDSIKNLIKSIDSEFAVRLEQLRQNTEAAYARIKVDKQVVDMDIETRRYILALRTAANDYVIAVERFATEVANLVMDARFYAAQKAEKQLELEDKRYEVDQEIAEIRVKRLEAEISEEDLRKQLAEVDVARTEVRVAEARARAVMAQASAKRTEARVAMTKVQTSMAEVDKLRAEADAAMNKARAALEAIYSIRAEAGEAEIAARILAANSVLESVKLEYEARVKAVEAAIQGVNEVLQLIPDLQEAQVEAIKSAIDVAAAGAEAAEYSKNERISAARTVDETLNQVIESRIQALEARLSGQAELAEARVEAARIIAQATKWASENRKYYERGSVDQLTHNVSV